MGGYSPLAAGFSGKTVKCEKRKPTNAKRMKKLIIATAALFFWAISAAAGKPDMKKPYQEPVKFAFGVHTGTDIGGAVPWPPGKTIGGKNKMSATPHLTPALGLSYTLLFNPCWSLSAESTYKIVSLDAKAWVENQIFVDREDDQWVSFRGTAFMEMSFPMMEFPVYVRYTFRNGINRVFMGGYYARVFNARFLTTPYKGMLFNVIDGHPDYDNPKGSVSPDAPYTQNFSDAMDAWDAGFLAGYERQIFNRIMLSGRFSMGFKDIFRHDKKYLTYNMLHMRGTITLSYMFLKK